MRPVLTFRSIVTPATRSQARAMDDSILRHHPDARVISLVSGAAADDALEPCERPEPQDLLRVGARAAIARAVLWPLSLLDAICAPRR